MKEPVKQKESLEERIKKRVADLKKRKAYYYFLSHISYPQNEKERNKFLISKATSEIEKIMPKIKKLIKDIKKYVPFIWGQDAITAVYLLLGKTYGNLETMISLSKEGKNVEIVELARSGNESLDLAFLFLEDRQEERLKNWFKGRIIHNKIARETFHKAINSKKLGDENIPAYEAKTEVYEIYSLYTHSSYAALLDTIDAFHEDLDYEKISGTHYTLRYFDGIIKSLTVRLLLELKKVFTKYKNLENLTEVEKLLAQMGNWKASEQEIKELLEKYKKD